MTSNNFMTGMNIAILGASGGIGSAIASRCHAEGATIYPASRDDDRYEQANWFSTENFSQVDACEPDDIGDWMSALSNQTTVHAAVNCVGSMTLKPLHRLSMDEWKQSLELNLTSTFSLLKSFVENLPSDGGSFLAFSSAAASRGIPNHSAISAAKSGIEGLIKSAASTYASRNLRANCIAPGLVETPLSETLLQSDRAREQSEDMHALGRLGQPDDPAQAALWLLNPDNDWVTGQVIGVDGGLSELYPK